jgi:nucleotidyltransferase substrate binding protein (TIGR01987 family)
MEILEKKYIALKKALETLRKSLIIIADPKNKDLYDSLRDSVIQRFEYSIDSLWKFLKFYIQEKENVDLETSSPRIILRRAEETGLISTESYKILISGLANRNLSSHIYNEETANVILKSIPHYYEVMQAIVDTINLKK